MAKRATAKTRGGAKPRATRKPAAKAKSPSRTQRRSGGGGMDAGEAFVKLLQSPLAAELVLTGLQSDDQGWAQVGVMLAEMLGLPHATIVIEVDASGDNFRVKRELESGWYQWYTMPLPALLTIQSGISQIRYATLKGIMAAKKKEIREITAPAEIVDRPSHQRIERVYLPQKTKQTQMLGNGDAMTGLDQPGEIGFGGMGRHAAHRHRRAGRILRPRRQRQPRGRRRESGRVGLRRIRDVDPRPRDQRARHRRRVGLLLRDPQAAAPDSDPGFPEPRFLGRAEVRGARLPRGVDQRGDLSRAAHGVDGPLAQLDRDLLRLVPPDERELDLLPRLVGVDRRRHERACGVARAAVEATADGLRESVAERTDALAARIAEDAEKVAADLAELRAFVQEDNAKRAGEAEDRHQTLAEALTEQAETHRTALDERLERHREGLNGKVDNHLSQITGKVDHELGRLTDRFDSFEGHFEGSFESVEGKIDRVDGRIDGLNGRLDGIDGRVNGVEGQFEGVNGHFEGVDGRMEAIDDRLEALNQRLNQLPQTMEVSELHRRLTELVDRPLLDHSGRLDEIDSHVTSAVEPVLRELKQRPDRHEFEETVTEAVENSHDDITKRFSSLEETVLALLTMYGVDTGIDTSRFFDISRLTMDLAGVSQPSNRPVVGELVTTIDEIRAARTNLIEPLRQVLEERVAHVRRVGALAHQSQEAARRGTVAAVEVVAVGEGGGREVQAGFDDFRILNPNEGQVFGGGRAFRAARVRDQDASVGRPGPVIR